MLHLVVLKELGEPSVWELSQGPVGEKEYSACGWDLKAKGEKPVSQQYQKQVRTFLYNKQKYHETKIEATQKNAKGTIL